MILDFATDAAAQATTGPVEQAILDELRQAIEAELQDAAATQRLRTIRAEYARAAEQLVPLKDEAARQQRQLDALADSDSPAEDLAGRLAEQARKLAAANRQVDEMEEALATIRQMAEKAKPSAGLALRPALDKASATVRKRLLSETPLLWAELAERAGDLLDKVLAAEVTRSLIFNHSGLAIRFGPSFLETLLGPAIPAAERSPATPAALGCSRSFRLAAPGGDVPMTQHPSDLGGCGFIEADSPTGESPLAAQRRRKAEQEQAQKRPAPATNAVSPFGPQPQPIGVPANAFGPMGCGPVRVA